MNIFNIVKTLDIKGKSTNYNSNFLFGKDETLQPKFAKIFGFNYSVNIYYFKINKPELNLEKKCINIHLPMSYRKKDNQKLIDIILLKMYTKIAANELENVMEKARHTFKYAPEDYEIRNLKNSIAICNNELQTIAFTPYIVRYSREIIEYIVFHEFCHLKYKKHSKKFYEMLKKYKPNYDQLAKQIANLKY